MEINHKEGVKQQETDWSLGDVLRFSKDGQRQDLRVFTPSAKVLNGEMVVELGPEGGRILFFSEAKNLINAKSVSVYGYKGEAEQTDKREVEAYTNRSVRLEILSTPGTVKRQVVFSFQSKTTAYFDLITLGLGDILLNYDLPKNTSREFVEGLIKKGVIEIGRRGIPVREVPGKEKLREATTQMPEGKIAVFHGTSLRDALGIAKIGLFAAGEPVSYRPILAEFPDVTAAKLAMDEWDSYPRTDTSGYGAIITFGVKPNEVLEMGNVYGGEKLFKPAQKMIDENERYRLQSGVGVVLPINEPRYLSPDHIEEVLLIKQTPKK